MKSYIIKHTDQSNLAKIDYFSMWNTDSNKAMFTPYIQEAMKYKTKKAAEKWCKKINDSINSFSDYVLIEVDEA